MADAPDVPGDQARTIEPLGRECPLPLLSPVEDRISQIRHRQDGVVGAAGPGNREVRLGHFGDDDVMVALFDDGGDAAFDGADGGIEDRGAVAAFMEGVAGELAVLQLRRFEEGEGAAFAVLSEHVGANLRVCLMRA